MRLKKSLSMIRYDRNAALTQLTSYVTKSGIKMGISTWLSTLASPPSSFAETSKMHKVDVADCVDVLGIGTRNASGILPVGACGLMNGRDWESGSSCSLFVFGAATLMSGKSSPLNDGIAKVSKTASGMSKMMYSRRSVRLPIARTGFWFGSEKMCICLLMFEI